MQNLAQILGGKRQYKRWLDEADILNRIKANAPSLLGQLHQHIQIGFLQNSVLFLQTNQSVWVSEIQFFKAQLLERINQDLPAAGRIKDIKVRVQSDLDPPLMDRVIHSSTASFEEKIHIQIQRRIENGQKLCVKCQKAYSEYDVCLFCRG